PEIVRVIEFCAMFRLRLAACGAAWQANATRFSAIGNAAEVVGQTPWSARDAPVPPLGQRGQRLAGCEQADGGVGRGPGGPPHDLCRCPAPEKRVALGCQPAPHHASDSTFMSCTPADPRPRGPPCQQGRRIAHNCWESRPESQRTNGQSLREDKTKWLQYEEVILRCPASQGPKFWSRSLSLATTPRTSCERPSTVCWRKPISQPKSSWSMTGPTNRTHPNFSGHSPRV